MKPQFTGIYLSWLAVTVLQLFQFFFAVRQEGQFSICVKKEETADLILSPMTWGIVVNWKKDIKYPFGARIEGIHKNAELTTKESFFYHEYNLTLSSSITNETKYGKIAKRSTRFKGALKNNHFCGAQRNRTKYSKYEYLFKLVVLVKIIV